MRKWWKLIVLVLVTGSVGFAAGTATKKPVITAAEISSAEKLFGLQFTPAERDSMINDVADNLKSYETLREVTIPNDVPPAIRFDPIPAGMEYGTRKQNLRLSSARHASVPKNFDELAFYSVRDLGELIRTRKIKSTDLTRMYIRRLKKYGPKLECVITLTEDLAMKQAKRADAEIAAGRYRGPLHGIPYGAKDLLAVRGYPTTWGATPYKDQMIDEDAVVIQKLDEAGAVLVAKLTMGALAWGDVWFGGKTRNPWNLEEGSSGSSAGSAAATSAGLVAFAIGTETWGSIVSPSTRCGVTGLRPTYGRVSRTGAMALSWSMDKIGPICRTAEDCAIVFNSIVGPDGIDQTLVDLPFNYDPKIDLRRLRVGYVPAMFEEDHRGKAADAATLQTLRQLGVNLITITLPDMPVNSLAFILGAEAAAAFDDLTRSGRDDLLVRQVKDAWPNVFRSSRLIPAVEYIQANRARYMLIQQMQQVMSGVDLYVAPSFGGDNLLLTNLTGHPCVVLPNGFDENGDPLSITFVGRLYDEATVLALANAYQEATGFDDSHPPLFQAAP
jgi:Asp-tRNA(Asn)/Glu-tRNA(Gln) amidotransferase A subunit family amidase